MDIKKESRKCFIPNKDFYSIPFKTVGGKIVVIAGNMEEAKELMEEQIRIKKLEEA